MAVLNILLLIRLKNFNGYFGYKVGQIIAYSNQNKLMFMLKII